MNLKSSLFAVGAAIAFLPGCQQVDLSQINGAIISNDSDVVYGTDDRIDLSQTSDPFWLDRADSTVALIESDRLTKDGVVTKIRTSVYGTSNMLCESEPFREQPKAAFCSGFLVNPTTIVTAGHCITNATDCATTSFVFGFAVKKTGDFPDKVLTDDVYTCASVVHTQAIGSGADFAVIKIDRAVTGHSPEPLRMTGELKVGDGLTVIGHPAGIPTKIAGGATVRSLENGFVVANLDTYGGNSGSAVFNSQTGEVEGILVRGEQDFKLENGCYISNTCPSDGCRGEDVTKISEVLPFLDSTGPVNPNPGNPNPNPVPSETAVFASELAPAEIPDNRPNGVLSPLAVTEAPKGRPVLVTVEIAHSFRGDLELSIVAPNGKEVKLKAQSLFDSADDVRGTYGLNLQAVGDLRPLADVAQKGVWMLKVSDKALSDTGVLESWKLTFQGKL